MKSLLFNSFVIFFLLMSCKNEKSVKNFFFETKEAEKCSKQEFLENIESKLSPSLKEKGSSIKRMNLSSVFFDFESKSICLYEHYSLFDDKMFIVKLVTCNVEGSVIESFDTSFYIQNEDIEHETEEYKGENLEIDFSTVFMRAF